MEKIIRRENLHYFAYTNEKIIKGKIKGIVIDFFGLGGQAMYREDTKTGIALAENDILFITPYTNPWGWMNKDEVGLADEIIDVLKEKHGLTDKTPLVAIGGSMGGLACIVYTKYAKHTPVGCVANCPVCDLPYHFTERVDLPRTIYSAFYAYDCTLDEALRSCSPLHLASTLPEKTEYTVFHCEKDSAVNIDMHSEKFVKELSKYRHVDYYKVPNKDHCDLGEEMSKKFLDITISYIEKNC
ncbi:MAG: hypothetical protein E7596_03045 [Ruminococcaceae bacterium]|nr:hypothetical protein [Oscillospiraceae bacterium]